FCDKKGNTLCWDTGGTIGYKGSRKSTPFAAQRAAEQCAQKAKKLGMKEVDVRIKGPGSGRESAIRAIQSSGLEIKAIEDVTPLPHNGCRARRASGGSDCLSTGHSCARSRRRRGFTGSSTASSSGSITWPPAQRGAR